MKMHAAPVQRLLTLAIVVGVIAFTMPMVPPRDAAAYNLLSSEQEASMGIEAFEQLKKQKKSIPSGAQVDQVNRVASRLKQVVTVPNAKWEFVVFEDATPNAFALPGGKVGVHSGLFQVVQSETQLAAVLGHELAHVTLRHSGKRVSRSTVGSALGGLAGMVLQRKTGMDPRVAQQVTQGAVTLRVLQFSRTQELEADRTGAVYMAKAGYDPQEAVTLWKQMSAYKAKSGGSAPIPFLSTHPMDERRIQELQAKMPEALSYYKSSKVKAQPAPAAVPGPATNVPKALPYPGPR